MKWKIEYVAPLGFVKETCEGLFTVDDCLRLTENQFTQTFWHPGINILLDLRQVDYSQTGYQDMSHIGQNHQKYDERIGGGKIAFLMGSQCSFGIGRQYEMITDGKVSSTQRVFLDEQTAIDWLVEESLAYAEH